eukprot:scaffold149_cov315-Pinguiococcus_pyrenoidosus.AAC.89
METEISHRGVPWNSKESRKSKLIGTPWIVGHYRYRISGFSDRGSEKWAKKAPRVALNTLFGALSLTFKDVIDARRGF